MSDKMHEEISSPSHYIEGRKYEPLDVINDWGINYNLGNVIKYISRAGRKEDYLTDLKKAHYYLTYEIKRVATDENEYS